VTHCGLIVTTCRRADALDRVLAAVATQSRRPDELLVAEDGNDPATATTVERFSATAPYGVRHLTQPHEGFRAGRIRNAAIAACACDYLILLDGDMVPHPRFIEDHLNLARPGRYTQGVRIQLAESATRTLLKPGARLPGPLAPGLGGLRRAYALRMPSTAIRLRGLAGAFVAIKACNQSFWREHLLAANGFDEAMQGWGAEDKELCARLDNAGVRRQTLIFAAIAYHLAHPPAPRDQAGRNRERWLETVRTGRRRCDIGIDRHSPV
jgi:glycosyltransferase involved in cell wall biosynthesis